MALSVREAASVRKARPARGPARAGAPRRRFTDNPRLIILGILLLIAGVVAMVTLADRSTELYPDFLSEVVLSALLFVDLTMVVVLVYLLARYIVKLIVERRRALPFARFRAKLVAALLAMTIVPAVLVLIIGSELIRNSADRWFSAPIDQVLESANRIAGDYYAERERKVVEHATRIARALAAEAFAGGDVEALRAAITPEIQQQRVGMVELYRAIDLPPAAGGGLPRRDAEALVAVESPSLPRGHVRASADRLASRAVADGRPQTQHDPLERGGELVRAAALVRRRDGRVAGVVVASDYLSGELAMHSRRITSAFEDYKQLRVLKGPLQGVYLSFFLMMTLMVLFSAMWMGVYVAKRITRPVQMLSDGAKAIGAGHLDHRIEQETADEFGSLVDAFNTMAAELAQSQRKLERSRIDMERKNAEIEDRRRYIETILERIATGVVSIDREGRVSTINSAAARLIGLDQASVGAPAAEVFGREELQPLGALLRRASSQQATTAAQEVALAREGRELFLAAAATPLQSEGGISSVLVFEDVTPLIRAQRVAAWRDVARRLAHEIKNPLTPIQLCAERMRRHFAGAPPNARALAEECTTTIISEVESLKALVDEFAQFARMPAPRAVPSNLHALLDDTLALYEGLFRAIRIERAYAPELPPVRLDPEQIKRVIINLVDNAVEAIGTVEQAGAKPEPGLITVTTVHDAANGVARIVIADNGPGISAADREKLFMPYYSTKRRGSGLGLAIVRRIIVEHGGSIEVGDHAPHGTKFTIELPC
ncbi:MAG TPA: ATP-binding protein [Vicinamibacterales bacterium]|nr:ATP-binding protein [Vicinamibacterales bacterium]